MSKRILIADDDPNLRTLIRYVIEVQTACQVCGEAVDGADAVVKAGTLTPDLIVIDYSMPGMNGIDAGGVIKAVLPNVPVILLTGEDSPEIRAGAISAGITAVVCKTEIITLGKHVSQFLN
jgi:DNA-binding NarL/FixJ family response regulator